MHDNNYTVSNIRKLVFIPVFLLLVTSAMAGATNTTCVDANTSQLNFDSLINGSSFTYNKTTYCAFGCNSNSGVCNSSNLDSIGMVATIVPIIAALGFFLLAIFWKANNLWETAFKVMFMFFGVFFTLAAFGIVNGLFAQVPNVPVAITNLATVNLTNMVYLEYIMVVFTMLFFLIQGVLYIRDVAKKSGGLWKNRKMRMETGK